MFNIHDERNATAKAESIIQNLSISAVPCSSNLLVQSLRKANEAAITAAAANPLAEEQLNMPRKKRLAECYLLRSTKYAVGSYAGYKLLALNGRSNIGKIRSWWSKLAARPIVEFINNANGVPWPSDTLHLGH